MKNIKKIFEHILNVFTIILVIFIIVIGYCVIKSKIDNKPYTDLLGYTFFEVVTGSMEDTINIGDAIIVKLIVNEELNIGDIVVFQEGEYLITHRIINMENEQITTKGDANNTSDEPITKEEVIGKVIKIIPNVGIWKQVLLTPRVFISIIITILLFTITISYNNYEKTNNKANKGEQNGERENSKE